MTIPEVKKLSIGDRVELRDEHETIWGTITGRDDRSILLTWDDGKKGAIYIDGTGTLHRICKKV